MQYLLTQEEYDQRDVIAKKEFQERNREMVQYLIKAIKWISNRHVIGKDSEQKVIEDMFLAIGKPPE